MHRHQTFVQNTQLRTKSKTTMSGRMLPFLVLCALVQLSSCAQIATYACYDSHIYFKLEMTGGETLYNIYTSDNARATTCDLTNAKITGDGSNLTPFSLDVDLTSGTFPDAVCGTTGTAASASLTLYTQGINDAFMYLGSDRQYVIACDTTATASGFSELSASAITGTLVPGTPTLLSEVLTLEMTDAAGNPLSSAVIGNDVKLRVAVVKPTKFAFGIRVTECFVQKFDGDASQVNLLDADGCVDPAGALKEYPDTHFTGVGTSDPGYVATSVNTFKMFKYSDLDTMFFKCTVIFCTTAIDTQCEAVHCVSARRRKRAAAQNTTTTNLNINVYGSESEQREAQNRLNGEECEQATSIQALTFGSIIGVLALISLILLFLLVVLLMRRNKSSRKEDNMSYVTSNPGLTK